MEDDRALRQSDYDDFTHTSETALNIGCFLGRGRRRIAVARDTSPAADIMARALIAGVVSSGADAVDLGIVPAPVACAIYADRADCVVMFGCRDGWESPPTLQIYNPDGSAFTDVQVAELMSSMPEEGSDKVGEVISDPFVCDSYIHAMLEREIHAGGYVILDCGCESPSYCAPRLLSEAGADVVSLNAHDCVDIQPKPPAVEKTQTASLSDFVYSSTGSIGISYNADGTRFALLDENGSYVSGGNLLALMLAFLEPNVAVVPFEAPAVVEYAFENGAGIKKGEECLDDISELPKRRLVRVKGDIESVTRAVRANNADFGGLLDGTFIFPSIGLCPDAVLGSAVMSEFSGARSIRNILAEMPDYKTAERRVRCEIGDDEFEKRLIDTIKDYDIIEMDVIKWMWKVLMPEGQYIISRDPSDSRMMNITAEAADPIYLATLIDQAWEIVVSCTT